jgi:hypothetical protein
MLGARQTVPTLHNILHFSDIYHQQCVADDQTKDVRRQTAHLSLCAIVIGWERSSNNRVQGFLPTYSQGCMCAGEKF